MNSTTKGREEITLKKVGSMDTWLRGETSCESCRGEGGHLGHTLGDYSLFLEHIPERQHSQRCLFQDKGGAWSHFPSLPLSITKKPLAESR